MYGVEEYGEVRGEEQMKAEIYARGPIACMINSEASQFNAYKGGVIVCDKGAECKRKMTDHVVVISGWGTDEESGIPYWVGRNSYGSQVATMSHDRETCSVLCVLCCVCIVLFHMPLTVFVFAL